MQPHPDFVDHSFAPEVSLASCRLTPLAPEQAEEDFEAVTGSVAALKGLFGNDWPVGLTLEDNRIDLAWHAREFTAARSFAWIIRDLAGLYLGCLYIYPAIGARGKASVIAWLCDRPDRRTIAEKLYPELRSYIAAHMPAGIALDWTLSPEA